MKRTAMIFRVVRLLLGALLCGSLTACQSEQDKLYDELVNSAKQNSQPESVLSSQTESSAISQAGEGKQLSGELWISLPAKENAIESWASKFRERHPDVKISFEYVVPNPSEGYPGDYMEQYTSKTVTALAGGEAPDIVNLAFVSFYKYAKTGLFEDLYELMEKDAGFNKEDYYTNIFEVMEDTEGHLYAMVPFFRFHFFILNDYMLYEMKTDVDEEFGGSVGYQDLIDLFWRGRASGAISEDAYFAPNFSKFFFEGLVIPQFLNEKTGEARFDTPEFIEYLEQTDALPFENTLTQGSTYTYNWPMFSPTDYFCQLMTVSLQLLGQVDGGQMAGCSEPVFYKGVNGDAPFTTATMLAIPKGPNAELAWEFLKFMIEEKEFPEEIDMYNSSDLQDYLMPYGHAMPVNKNNCKKLITSIYGSDSLAEKFCTYNETLNARASSSSSSEIMENLKDIFISYYDNHLISAEECAKQLQERAWIYLNE